MRRWRFLKFSVVRSQSRSSANEIAVVRGVLSEVRSVWRDPRPDWLDQRVCMWPCYRAGAKRRADNNATHKHILTIDSQTWVFTLLHAVLFAVFCKCEVAICLGLSPCRLGGTFVS